MEPIRSYRDYLPIADIVLDWLVGDLRVVVGQEALEAAALDEERLMIAANHGPPHTPLVGMCAMARLMADIGRSDRTPLAVTFRAIYKVPVLRDLFAYLTQLPGPFGFDAIVDHFEERGFSDLCLAPEGQNCLFGDPGEIREFTSPRFVELAMELDAPILVAVGVGMEAWALEVPMPDLSAFEPLVRLVSGSLADTLAKEQTLCMPSSLEKIPELRFGFELHRPELTIEELRELSSIDRRAAVREEAARLREVMQALTQQVREAEV